MSQAIEWILKTPDSASLDQHWKAQFAHCDLQTRLSEFGVVAMYNGDTLGDDASCIMAAANLEQFNRVDGSSHEQYWKSNRHWHGPRLSEQSEQEDFALRKLFSRASAEKLMKRYEADYELFKLPAFGAVGAGGFGSA